MCFMIGLRGSSSSSNKKSERVNKKVFDININIIILTITTCVVDQVRDARRSVGNVLTSAPTKLATHGVRLPQPLHHHHAAGCEEDVVAFTAA